MDVIQILGSGVVAFSVGAVIGYFGRQFFASKQMETAEGKVSKIISDAKDKAAEILLDSKNKAVKILDDVKNEEIERNRQVYRNEQRVIKKEEGLEQKYSEIEKQKTILQDKAKQVMTIKEEVEKIKGEQIVKLEKVAQLDQDDAKNILIKKVEEDQKVDILKRMKQLEEEGAEDLQKRANDIIVQSIQKYSGSHTAETTTSTVSLPSDEMKGRIIGREGRNIKTLEKATGVEIIIDDTPLTIVVSGFDPIRRQVAKLSLEQLMNDGRIHPARIEEIVEEVKAGLVENIKKAGEIAVSDVGIVGFDPKLIQLLGRLKFRTSYGQNVLIHSIEVAHLSASLASELGANVAVARKAGLLHDIGKAVDHEIQGTHVEIGRNILTKFKISEDIIKAMQSHHEDFPYETTEAVIVRVADAISASRPGARKDSLENYLKRLEELENIANSFDEVEKSYAIQAGREIRVFVTPEKINDLGAMKLSRKIADGIEENLNYPGEIKVHVIRETRAVEYAR
ncbi:MAG: ribonuclease Y [Candidatus Pacebacteria bacterium]|nr:ribonuclease Y [Candidatus Paceibacterota bacterium]